MKLMLNLFIALCLIVTASGAWRVQHVGGEFGRAWLINNEAQKSENETQENEVDPLGQNGAVTSNDSMNNGSLDEDWLDGTGIIDPFAEKNNTTNEAQRLYRSPPVRPSVPWTQAFVTRALQRHKNNLNP